MKINPLLRVSLFCILLSNCIGKQEVRQFEKAQFNLQLDSLPELKKIVEQIEEYNIVESAYIGDGGSASEQWARYEQLKQIATISQLIALTDYPNSVVRCYAFEALATRNSNQVFPILMKHLKDTTSVETLSGCLGHIEYTGDYFIGVLLYADKESEGYKLNDEEKKILDSVFLNDSSIALSAKSRALENLQPTDESYGKVRQLVEKDRNKAALIALAKYKKAQDRALIASFFQTETTQYAALETVLEFSDEYFYDSVVQFFEQRWGTDMNGYGKWRLCYQVLAKYPKEKTVELFNRTFRIEEEYQKEAFCEFLYLALSKYPNQLYDPIKAKIKLSDYAREQVKYELENQ